MLLGDRNKFRRNFLSRASMVVGVLFLLLVPLCISDTWQIYRQSKLQSGTHVSQQIEQLEQIKVQVNRTTTSEELNKLLANINLKVNPTESNTPPEQLKNKLLSKIAEAKNTVNVQAEANDTKTLFNLIKNLIKLSLQALAAGMAFLIIGLRTKKTAQR